MPNAPPALASATPCAAENSPAPRSAKVIVRKKKRMTRPRFRRVDATLCAMSRGVDGLREGEGRIVSADQCVRGGMGNGEIRTGGGR